MSRIDDYNYACDPRTQGAAKPPILYLENGDEVELPMKWDVCPVCQGKGTHVNPSIDAGGISMECFHDDPDFYEDYMNGQYDQTCNRCNGRTTVPVTDWSAMSDEHRELYEAQLEADAAYEAERRAEMMMGC